MNKKLIADCSTGEIYERDLTSEELAQEEIDEAAFQIAKAEREAVEAEIAAKREALLNRLGITEEEAQLLLK